MDILHQTIQEQKLNTNILKNKANNLPNDTDALSDAKIGYFNANHTETETKINISNHTKT